MALLKRIGVGSFAKIYSLLLMVVGLLEGILYAVNYSVNPLAATTYSNMGLNLGYSAIIVLPLVYAAMGFLIGLLLAWLYNSFAGMVGGIEVDLEVKQPAPVHKKRK
jgi:hypothetical protein